MVSPEIIWIIFAVILFIIEAATVNLVTIWFALGAILAVIASLLGFSVFTQCTVCIVSALILLIFTRPAAVRLIKKTPTNVDSLIGKNAVVTTAIDNIKAAGEVKISGKYWSARNAENDDVIEVNTVVEICRVEGVKLMVKLADSTRVTGGIMSSDS